MLGLGSLGRIIDAQSLDGSASFAFARRLFIFSSESLPRCATATILGQAAQAAPPFRRRSSSFGSPASEREFWPAEELLLANLKFLFTGHAASLL
jgi:hypothetical protein